MMAPVEQTTFSPNITDDSTIEADLLHLGINDPTGSITADSRILLDVTSTGPKPRSVPWLRPDIERTTQL